MASEIRLPTSSDLSSGIDRDYNYLKSVERHVDRTGQDVRERGITSDNAGRRGERGTAGNKKVSKSWVPGSALQKYLSDKDIRVEKAPTGMSRQKANKTRVTNKGNVMWTVEWITNDGKKSVDDENPEGRQITELWGEVMAKRLNAEKGKKRKRESEKQVATQSSENQEREPNPTTDASTEESQPPTTKHALADQVSTSRESAAGDTTDQLPDDTLPTVPKEGSTQATTKTHTRAPNDSEKSIEAADAPIPEHFYLLRPFTASKSVVLIPLDASKSLTESLKRQTVLEFPTIYVLPEQPDSLPAGFQLSNEYDKVQKAEEAEVDGLVKQTNQTTGGALSAVKEEEKSLDANSILDMLKRDVGV